MSLDRTFGLLIALSLASTGLAALISRGGAGRVAMAAVLVLALVKAHLVARSYLGLGRVPSLLRGLDICLGLTMLAMLGLALAG
jgi:hypothetical protein